MNNKLLIAFCVCFNDIDRIKHINSSKKTNVREYLSYKKQFDCLYDSIVTNIKSVNYKIYIFNTIPFSEKLNKYYSDKGIIILTRKSDNEYYNRPEAYIEDINCDYKLIIDCDTLILNDFTPSHINFIKKYDCMGMYGHRNINYGSYMNILKKLNLKIPKEIEQTKNYKNDYKWTNLNTLKYNCAPRGKNIGMPLDHNLRFTNRLFPYFNNGCILIKNSLSKKLGLLWKQKRLECFNKMLTSNIGEAGELTIGLCINHITNNWYCLPKGFNLVCNIMTPSYINLKVEKYTDIYLVHYQNVKKDSPIYKKYLYKYLEKYL